MLYGGITAIEATYSTPDAPKAVAEIRERRPEALVGAGTVRTAHEAAEAAEAGAQFLVSPGSTPRVVAAMLATGRPVIAGALTPTEVMTAVELGVHAVKLFPGSLGGPGYLRALHAPFPEVPIVPTGGVSMDNVAAWLAAGALAVGVGGELCPSAAIASADWATISDTARAYHSALCEARS